MTVHGFPEEDTGFPQFWSKNDNPFILAPKLREPRDGRASPPVVWWGDGVVAPPVCATGLSLIARGRLIDATPRGQPWTPAVTLPQGRTGRSVRRMTVWWTFR